jgi:hypothetical protein
VNFQTVPLTGTPPASGLQGGQRTPARTAHTSRRSNERRLHVVALDVSSGPARVPLVPHAPPAIVLRFEFQTTPPFRIVCFAFLPHKAHGSRCGCKRLDAARLDADPKAPRHLHLD